MSRKVYADNAATTAVAPQVLEAMLPFYKEAYGNPSSLYSLGQEAKKPLEEAREAVARCLGAHPGKSTLPAAAPKATTGPLRARPTP